MTIKTNNKTAIKIRETIISPYFEVYPSRIKSKIVFTGVIGVSEIGDNVALIKCHGGKIKITGKNISICVLEHNTLEVSGKVEGIYIDT